MSSGPMSGQRATKSQVGRSRIDWTSALLWGFPIVLVLFIAIPIASVFLSVPGGNLGTQLVDTDTLNAIRLSLVTSTTSLAVIMLLGIPTARVLTRRKARGMKLVDTILDIPIVLPPAVAGLALLLAFAPRSPIGSVLLRYGVILPGNIAAVIMAQTFVAMPFFVRSARTAFEEIDPRIEVAAGLLSPSGLYSFRRVVLPLASRGLVAGAILAWGRAMGEFGATLLFAGNLPGITQTMPLAIYLDLAVDVQQASFVSCILIAISFAVIIGVRYMAGSRETLGTRA
ncbi:MAG TPA: molybdate ABC transporter permease subunit [Nitrososphaerales archaeon]|nr:molybdate ABC transporter permease subunit [Nitrososphaerales archaeon]